MELLPCPFCGNKAVLVLTLIACNKCNIFMNSSEEWNTRHSPWISLIENFIKEVNNHMNNGHKELSINWILNQLKETE